MFNFIKHGFWIVVTLMAILSIAALVAACVDAFANCTHDTSLACLFEVLATKADSIAYVLTGFATLALVAYTLRLANLAGDQKTQLALTNEHNERIERAYVQMRAALPGLYEIFDPTKADQAHPDHMLKICVRNFGNTPATVTDAPMSYTIVDQPDPLPAHALTFPANRHGNAAFLASGEEFSFFQRIPSEEFDPAGDRFLWVYGYVDYTDTFGKRYRSGWARRYKRGRDDTRLYGGPQAEAYRLRDNLTLTANDPNNYDRRRGENEP